MNIRLCLLGAVAVLATAMSGLAETVYLVETSDMRKVDAWEIMTREEVAKLQKEIQEETRVFPAALAAAKKAWDEDELFKKSPFPGSYLSPRKVSVSSPFTSRKLAEEKKQAREERQADALAKEAKEAKAKPKDKRNENADAMRQMNITKALEKLNQEMTKALKRDVPQNGY